MRSEFRPSTRPTRAVGVAVLGKSGLIQLITPPARSLPSGDIRGSTARCPPPPPARLASHGTQSAPCPGCTRGKATNVWPIAADAVIRRHVHGITPRGCAGVRWPQSPPARTHTGAPRAHRTEGACICSRRRRPLGNGMPMRNAAGATIAAVRITLAANGHPAAALTRGEAPNANAATTAATPPRTRRSLRSLPATRRRLSVLPRPLATMHREHDHRQGAGRAFLATGRISESGPAHRRYKRPLSALVAHPPGGQRGALAAGPPRYSASPLSFFRYWRSTAQRSGSSGWPIDPPMRHGARSAAVAPSTRMRCS